MTSTASPRGKSGAGTILHAGCVGGVILAGLALHLPPTAVVIIAALVAVSILAVRVRFWWRRYSSGGWIAAARRSKYQGWASRRDVGKAVRAAAALTRKIAPGTSLLVLGTRAGRFRQPGIAVCRENSALYLGPPGYGKTAALACHAADAPGALFATSTKPDLLLHTLHYRAWLGGRTWILNPDGCGNIPTTLAWSPLEGCQSSATAERRAGDLMTASPRDKTGKDSWHEARGARLLRYMLHAAAIAGATMYEVDEWVNDPLSAEPMSILEKAPGANPRWAGKLAGLLADCGDNLGALVASASAALDWMDNEVMAAAATPAPGTGFSAWDFARSRDSVYLIGRNRAYGSFAPYFAALGAEIFEQLKWHAMDSPGGRLETPATFVLDEMPLTCPMAVHDMLADSRGYLITLTMGAQTPSQLRAMAGENDGATIRSASPVEVILGGEKTEDMTGVLGERDTWADSRDSSGAKNRAPGSEQLLPREALRAMRKGRAVVLMPECKQALVDLPAIWDRPGHQRLDLGRATEILASQPAVTRTRPLPPVAADHVPALTDGEVPAWPASR